jgi:hypothetical protein
LALLDRKDHRVPLARLGQIQQLLVLQALKDLLALLARMGLPALTAL